jgi:hypothetical protein
MIILFMVPAIAEMIAMHCHTQLSSLKMGSHTFFPRLVWNWDPPNLYFSSSQYYRCNLLLPSLDHKILIVICVHSESFTLLNQKKFNSFGYLPMCPLDPGTPDNYNQ